MPSVLRSLLDTLVFLWIKLRKTSLKHRTFGSFYGYDILAIIHKKEELTKFIEEFNPFLSNFKFTYGRQKERVALLDINVTFRKVFIRTDF